MRAEGVSFLAAILWRPEPTWDAVHAAAPDWRRSILRVVAPLALVPALAWPLGSNLAASFFRTFSFCIATVLIAAAAIYALAPLFSTERHWDRAVAVAAYSSAPVFLASPLLAWPTLTILVIAAFFHACFLCGIGVRRLLGCRHDDAAMYVAAAGFVSGLAGLVLGGLSSAFGIL